MRFFISLVVGIIALSACFQISAPITQKRGDGKRSESDGHGASADSLFVTSGDENGNAEGAPSAIYVCGVDNSASDSLHLVLTRDSILLLAYSIDIPSGIGSDPDTHFLFSDSLYTTTTWKENTIIALNGKPVISFEGKEYLCGLLPTSQGLWTLGNKRSGEGFCLRLDGRQVYLSSSGMARDLYSDGGHIYFRAETTLGEETGLSLVEDGTAHSPGLRHGKRVLDAMVCDGTLWLLEEGEQGWIVSSPEECFHYPDRPPFQFKSARLYRRPQGRCAAVISLVASGIGMPVEIICMEGEEQIIGGGMGSYHYFDSDTPYHLTYVRDLSQLCITSDVEIQRLDSVRISGRGSAAVWRNKLYLGLSTSDGGKALMWKDGEMVDLGFKGYPTGVSLSPPK